MSVVIVKFAAAVHGGREPDVWNREVCVEGEGLGIAQALANVEAQIEDEDAIVVAIEEID